MRNHRAIRPRTPRARTAALLAVALLLGAVWLIIQLKDANSDVPLRVIFVRREAMSTSENILDAALRKLIDEHNARGGIPIRLDPWVPKDLDGATVTARSHGPKEAVPKVFESLSSIYQEIAKHDDIVAVVDNSWGIELKAPDVAETIRRLDKPIVFLNGDRFDEKGADKPWVFLGTADHIPAQFVGLVNEIRRKEPAAHIAFLRQQRPVPSSLSRISDTPSPAQLKPVIANVNESGITFQPYGAAQETLRLLDLPNIDVIDLPCGPRWQLMDRNALMTVRERLVGVFPNFETDERKIVIAFTHASWGSELVRWIDSRFRSTTIVAYQSAVSSDRPVPLREGTGNQLILLGQEATAAPAPLLVLHSELSKEREDLAWNQTSDVFFLRRAVVASELLLAALGDVRAEALDVGAGDVQRAIAMRAAAGLRDMHGRIFRSRLGLLEFDPYGVERGNNHISLRQGASVNSYPLQLSKSATFLPNLQVRLSRMHVTDLDIRQSTMRIAFVLHITCDPAEILKTSEDNASAAFVDRSSITERLDRRLGSMLRFGEAGDAEFSRALVGSKSTGDLTEMQYTVSGQLRIPDMKPWRYPFDSHFVAVPVNISEPSSRVRVSIAQEQMQTLRTETLGDSGGWTVRGRWVEISHRAEAATVNHGISSAEPLEAQFSSVQYRLLLQRKPWSAIVLVYLPLALIALGSTSILFIQLGDTKNPVAPAEVLKTQSELCLGCLLAVVTYLISYAGLVPRIERPLYCDALLGMTLLLVAFNFIFIVAFAHRETNPLLRFWTVTRYRVASAVAMIFIFGLWPAPGFL